MSPLPAAEDRQQRGRARD